MACFVIAFIVIVIIAIAFSVANAKQTDRDWETAAGKLRLHFVAGNFLQARRIEGALRGHWVCVDTFTRSSGKHSSSFTRYTVRFAEPLGLGLRITRQGFFSPLMSLFGAQDISVGDADFDNNVVVKGRDADQVVDFLTPERRSHVHRVVTMSNECVIDDVQIQRIDRGVERDPEKIARTVRQLVGLACQLTSTDGEISEESVAVIPVQPIEAVPVQPVQPPPLPVEEVVPVSPLDDPAYGPTLKETAPLFAPYQTPQAAAPVNLDVPTSPAPVVERPVEPLPPVSTFPATVDDADVSIETVCRDVFDPNLMTFQASNLFEQRYQNRHVNWAGTLRRADGYASDLNFGNEPGSKAVFDICEIDAGLLGSRIVQAVVQLQPNSEAALQPLIGERINFSGRLLCCDGFTRTLYIAEGRVA